MHTVQRATRFAILKKGGVLKADWIELAAHPTRCDNDIAWYRWLVAEFNMRVSPLDAPPIWFRPGIGTDAKSEHEGEPFFRIACRCDSSSILRLDSRGWNTVLKMPFQDGLARVAASSLFKTDKLPNGDVEIIAPLLNFNSVVYVKKVGPERFKRVVDRGKSEALGRDLQPRATLALGENGGTVKSDPRRQIGRGRAKEGCT